MKLALHVLNGVNHAGASRSIVDLAHTTAPQHPRQMPPSFEILVNLLHRVIG